MGLPMLKSFCCCMGLQTGTLVIGYLYTFVAVVELFMYTMIVTLRPVGGADGAPALSAHKFAFYVASAVVSCIQLLCGILLIIGATKKRASLTLPWTIVTGILAAVFFILCLTAVSLILQDTGSMFGEEAFVIFFHLARACVSIYCVMVVHSRHKEIMNEKQDRRFTQSARLYSPVDTYML